MVSVSMLYNPRNPLWPNYFLVAGDSVANYFNADTVRNNNPLEGIEYDGIYPAGTLLRDLGGRCEVLHNGCIMLVARVCDSSNEAKYIVIG